MSDPKRPTAQDIETVRTLFASGFREALRETPSPEHAAWVAQQWAQAGRVIDYAAERLKAEEEGERVPEVEAPEDVGDNDGWIPWAGGDCPVPGDTLVEAEDRNGRVYLPAHAAGFRWDHYGWGTDIVRYRIVQTNGDSND